MDNEQIRGALEAAHAVAAEAKAAGRHPFGAVLVGPDDVEILLRQGNEGTVRHAETELARRAAAQFGGHFLAGCTLATNFEPCAMCAGAIYWANIGRVVYGVSEAKLLDLTGANAENPTLDLPCRVVFASGQKPIEVIGPVPEMEAAILELHQDFWA